jgi:hypothetical protein
MSEIDHSASILVVDDEESLTDLVSSALRFAGYEVRTESNGFDALRSIKTATPDLIVPLSRPYIPVGTGRITHIHSQVILGSGLAATSQIAFPMETTEAVYAVDPYAAKGPNTSVAGFAQDGVFSDGTQYQMARVTGGVDARLIATLLVGIAGGS